uniref:Putative single strand-specific nuclease n=1 Tax=Trypanosoma vivax (strain Y486) TaxID=1055687 RepID=G0TWH6_TRYVY|nr:putative single strand-specific nuclease [Trypanosoma vivax Y486]
MTLAARKTTLSLCVALAITVSALPAPAHGWWALGHMLVAEIALRHLKPEVARTVQRYSARLSESGPFPKTPDFVQMSAWADDLKGYGLTEMGGWHYTNKMYVHGNHTTTVNTEKKPNVETALRSHVKALKRSDAPPYVLQFALANVAHFYGDIHQPLHTTAMVSAKHPKGDRGGNDVSVMFRGRKMNLHAVWDSMCDGGEFDPERPLSASSYEKVRDIASDLLSRYNFSEKEKTQTNPSVMVGEGYQLAKTVVYDGVDNNTVLTDEYITKCRDTVQSRVTLAGHRLATQLNDVFSAPGVALESSLIYFLRFFDFFF